MNPDKTAVAEFWNKASCGEDLYLSGQQKENYETQARVRYELEPYILEFADFKNSGAKRVLEIGVGLGADHQEFAEAGAELFGCDLTERAIQHTSKRLKLFGLHSMLRQVDAEALPYEDESFDLVYSWGVLHHSPDTPKAVDEAYRVLKPGGQARIMIYHRHSFVGYMLWLRFALLRCRPFTSLDTIYSRHLESPGTKAYSIPAARRLFGRFREVSIQTVLTHGDLLSSLAGQRHKGVILGVARKVWPRWLIRTFFPGRGLFMLIRAAK